MTEGAISGKGGHPAFPSLPDREGEREGMREEDMITLILGGARSGKSELALQLGEKVPGRRAFVATAQASDAEMAERISCHQERRGKDWDLFEEPLHLGSLLRQLAPWYQVIVVDCLTLWMGNRLRSGGGEGEAEAVMEELARIREAGRLPGVHLILVSNEVGMGIVPNNPLARSFRDLSGRAHQFLAGEAEGVYFCLAGIPLRLKG